MITLAPIVSLSPVFETTCVSRACVSYNTLVLYIDTRGDLKVFAALAFTNISNT
jgi:hypothetical protein